MKKTVSIILAVLMLTLTALPCFAGTDTCPNFGDVNLDSEKAFLNDGISIADVRLILRNAIGLDKFSDSQKARADLDGNSKVTVDDARLVLRLALKKSGATLPDHPVSVVTAGTGKATDADSEYNILGSSKYVVSATVTDRNGVSAPMKIARNGNNVYLEMSYSGIELGVLLKDGKTYMVSIDRKYSLEFTDKVYSAMDEISEAEAGTMKKDMSAMTDPSQYSFPCPDLSTADKVEGETVICPVCGKEIISGKTVYTFGDDINKTEVYMNGKELLKTVTYKYGVVNDTTEFEYVSADVPDSYFALPTKSANRYPTVLQTPKAAILAFFLQVVDMEELLNA